jgi:hypothetical protein
LRVWRGKGKIKSDGKSGVIAKSQAACKTKVLLGALERYHYGHRLKPGFAITSKISRQTHFFAKKLSVTTIRFGCYNYLHSAWIS